jgi:hypothetical protein
LRGLQDTPNPENPNPEDACLRKLSEIFKRISQSEYQLIPAIVDATTFPPLTEGRDSATGKELPHLTATPSSVTTKETAALYREGIRIYWDILERFVAKILSGTGIVRSMIIFRDCLDEAHSGGIYRGSTDWIINVQNWVMSTHSKWWNDMSLTERAQCVMYALVTSNLSINSDGNATCTDYHQGNGSVLNFLANANDKTTMIEMINTQSGPLAYQRRTTVTDDQFAVGVSKLGGPDFYHTLMEVSKIPREYVYWELSSDVDYLQQNVVNPSIGSTKLEKASEFANRTRLSIISVAALLQVLTDGSHHTLTVDGSTGVPVVLANTTLPREMLRRTSGERYGGQTLPYLWTMFPHQTLSGNGWGGTGNMKVLAVMEMPMGEVMFVCEGANPFSKTLGFNFPVQLANHMHSAKAAFEAL